MNHRQPRYQNFLALTHNLAPDGDKINFVGLSSLRKTVCLTRLRSEIELCSVSSGFEPIKVEGILNPLHPNLFQV